ncbi:MAG: NAD(P)H-dependent oxidoreductase [Proteobacteria bacterium]|nr:NAD(P)H-dependent oxidoreductase [Pseudomonadota bacterium]
MTDASALSFLGICGSLRSGSLNARMLRAAAELLPEGVGLTVAPLHDIPLYDGDVEAQGVPAPVQALRDAIRAADALLIATPEYNHSIPGVLKNAIDWASRPPEQPFAGKPIAIMGASPGMFGTVRSQLHLRQVLVALDGRLLGKPEVMVGAAANKFDAAGRLTDETTRKHVAGLVEALKGWTLRLRA